MVFSASTYDVHQRPAQRPAAFVMNHEGDRLEQNVDRDVVEGYDPKSWTEDFPPGCFLATRDFIERPRKDRVSASWQAIDIHRRDSEIDNVTEPQDHVATANRGRGLVANQGVNAVIEHYGVCD